jgi:polyhydroxyalkanoate synthesis regulator phasin
MREVAQRAVHWKQLHDPSYPGSFIIWAKRMQFPVPTELEEKAVAYGQYIGDWNTLYDDLKLKYDQLVNERAATSAQTVTTLNDLREKWTKQYRELSEASSANLAEATAGLAERNAKIEALMDELGKLQQQLAAVPAGRPLGQREADSLRTLIIGMATGGYGYDPTAIRSDAVKDIVDDILKLGLNLSDDTVRKHLKQSAELLPPADSPERNKDR